MTSVLRHHSLIDVRTRNFILLADCFGYVLNDGFTCSSLMERSDFDDAFDNFVVDASDGILFKDLGRQITVYDNTTPNVTGSPHVAVFRQVMVMRGIDQEGIDPAGSTQIFYICVWLDKATETGSNALGFRLAEVARLG
jgi:hypothetical protein